MKNHVLKIVFTCLLLFVSILVFSQKDFQGKAYYESKTTVDMSPVGGGYISEDRANEISNRMKSMIEKTYVLTFNQSESLYQEEEKSENPSDRRARRWASMMSDFTGGPQYKNITNRVLLQEQELFGKQFLIKDSLSKLNWKMVGETKQIGDYMCFKATITKTVDAETMLNLRRPSREEEVEQEIPTKKDIEIVAWYTMQIPVNHGPDAYWGLPGLILEIHADRTSILCTKIILNPEVKESIEMPSKGKEVTKTEYSALVNKKTEEMRQSFRNSGGSGGGRR